MVTDNRPLSPHLQVYRPQLTSAMSISHRITGIVLSIGLVAVVAWVLSLASGPESYGHFMAVASHPLGLIVLAAWTLALFYHLLNGIRHLFWDAGALLDIKSAYASGYAVLVGAVILTIVSWWGALS